jgi:hypothetical protein
MHFPADVCQPASDFEAGNGEEKIKTCVWFPRADLSLLAFLVFVIPPLLTHCLLINGREHEYMRKIRNYAKA